MLVPVDDLAALRRRRSVKWRKYAPDVLPLPVAEMDFALAPAVRDALTAAVAASDTGYAFAGPELGESLARFAAARWGLSIDPGTVDLAPDVGVACVDVLRAMCAPGDSVVICPPVYPPFFAWVAESGCTLTQAPLRHTESGQFRLDLDALESAFATHPRAFVLCSPHNPVGRVHAAEELAEVVRLAHAYGVYVIADEIHAPLVLPGAAFTPFLSVPGAAEVGVSLMSASKAFNLAGLKCALIVTASDTMRALVNRRPEIAQWRAGHFGVLATVAALDDGGEWLDCLLETLDARRARLGDLLHEHLPGVTWAPPEATYLAWLDCRAYGDGATPQELFLDTGRVAVEPGPAFGTQGSGWVRLNFATSEEILTEAVRRMGRATSAGRRP